jgi:hypothetical protein
MNTPPTRFLAAIVAVIVIGGFAFLYGYGIYLCLTAQDGKPPEFNPPYVYVATALAGLVGGIAAMVFNEKLPDAPKPNPPAPQPAASPSASGLAAGMAAFKDTFSFSASNFLSTMSTVYVLVYFAAALLAIVTWIKMSDHTPDLIKNLALIGIGLFVAIARSFFTIPPPPKP